MPSAGPRMEVLTETGLRDQAHKIIIQSTCQLVMSVHFESTRHQPGGVEPGRTAPIAPRLVTRVGQVEARNAVHVRRTDPECLAGGCRNQSGDHLARQTRQHQRDEPGHRTLGQLPIRPLVPGQK